MAKILISGGLGYVGSILTELLLKNGHKITIIDNNLYQENSLSNLYINTNLSVVKGDVRDFGLMTELLKKTEIIIPLAALVGAPICEKDPIAASSINKDAIYWLIKNTSSDQKIIMPTTNSAYGSGQENNYCDENSLLSPISKYARDKVDVEKRLLDRDNVISLRLATVFGMSPRMRLDLLVNDFVFRAVKDRFLVVFEGHFKRNYIHVRDVANCFQFCLNNFDTMKNQVFNVGLSDANLSKLELCEEIKKLLPNFYFCESELSKDPDQRNYIVSNKKIEKTGFRTKVSLQEGINELIKGFVFIDNLKNRNA